MNASRSPSTADQFIGEFDCHRITSLSRTTRWRLERAGQFPARRRISPNRIAWLRSEVDEWLVSRSESNG